MLKARGRGFSLIELLVAVSVIIVMMAVALPNFNTWIRNARVRAVAEALQSSLRLAQAEAQRRNQSVVLFRTDSKDCAITSTASVTGMQWQIRSVPNMLATGAPVTIQCGVLTDVSSNLTLSSGTTAAICFTADGRQTSLTNPASIGVNCTAGAISYGIAPTTPKAEDRSLRVDVSLSGAVRLCDPNKSNTAPDGCR